MRRSALPVMFSLLLATAAHAQDSVAAPTVPASMALNLRQALALTDSQVAKLREVRRQQAAAFDRTVAAFLRAEAEVVASTRSDDPVARRAALERRARVAIDAELARLKWEKDVRALLTEKQAASLSDWAGSMADRHATPVLWQSLVAPLALRATLDPQADSGEVRVSVLPNHADIYLNGEKRGSGRKFFFLPVGKYELRLHAFGCAEIVQPIEVVKGPPLTISKSLTCTK